MPPMTIPVPPDAAAEDDFAALLAAYDAPRAKALTAGQQVSGTVVHIGQDTVFVALNAAKEGALARSEVTAADGTLSLAVGDQVQAFVVSMRDGIVLSRQLGADLDAQDMLETARISQLPVPGLVTGMNTGGLEVQVGKVRGFCPLGQVDLHFVDDPQQFVGQTLSFQVREIKEGGRQVILSRRAVLQAERDDQARTLLASLAVGQQLTGTVTRLAPFGAFVDLGGVDGLVPISELAYGYVTRPEDLVEIGERLTVEVLRIEVDPKRSQPRIALSRRATLADPWDLQAETLQVGTSLAGQVTRLEPFGAFIALFDGIEGLAHISQLSNRRLNHPSEVLEVGQQVRVEVLTIDRGARRIGLALEAEGGAAAPTGDRAPRASLRQEERADLATYRQQQASQSASLGTLGDLLQGRGRSRS